MLDPGKPARLLGSLLILAVLVVAGYLVLRHRGRAAPPPAAGEAYGRAAVSADLPAADDLRAVAREANVVVCVIDAARADHVGCYGYARDTTPNIDRLAGSGTAFEQHFSQYPETKMSTACLFTSQYPDTHLAYGDRRLAESTFTLAQGLRAAGLHTVLFSQNGYASPMWGLGEEFDEAYYEPHLKEAGRDLPDIWRPEALLEQVECWLEKRPRSRFFAYVHFMPPHDPYIAPPGTRRYFAGQQPPEAWLSDYAFDEVERERRAKERPWSEQHQGWMLNLYDGNLRYADWAVGELERLLREAGAFESTVLIVTSDHGEAFGEHGYRGHTFSAYDETIRIPLIIKLPRLNVAGRRISALTQSVDVMPTVLDLFEAPYPRDGVQGRSLLPLMTGEAGEVNDYVFARAAGQPPSYVIRSHDWMLVLYRGGQLRALYDLKEDPRALQNVIESRPEEAGRMVEAFRAFARSQTAPPLQFVDSDARRPQLPEVNKIEVNEEMRRSLEALGYLR
ncbi:MAG: sulfatase [Armatimonadota bacterium]|nr:MAG: sulfatase [Armatimonadota bacterium]